MRDLNTTTLMIKTKIDPQYNKYCSPVTGTGLAKIGGLYTETVHNRSVLSLIEVGTIRKHQSHPETIYSTSL